MIANPEPSVASLSLPASSAAAKRRAGRMGTSGIRRKGAVCVIARL